MEITKTNITIVIIAYIGMPILLFLSVNQCRKRMMKVLLNKKCVVELNSGKIIEECGSCNVEGNFINGYSSDKVKHYKTVKLDKICE